MLGFCGMHNSTLMATAEPKDAKVTVMEAVHRGGATWTGSLVEASDEDMDERCNYTSVLRTTCLPEQE
jgi:hypothetical protein